jgi:glycosyltransferase involved in cell wall biosynthesis
MCKVSIILPCYNVSAYIDRCMQSILAQTYKDYEVICINDGSTDDTLKLLQSYELKYPKIIHVYSFENQGPSQARNEGIHRSKGDYIAFFDSDDYVENNLLEIACSICEKDASDAVQFYYVSENENGDTDWVMNGSKHPGIYDSKQIISSILPNIIGWSYDDLTRFGTSNFAGNKEMASVCRFLFRRKILIDNGILFPKGLSLAEDKIFIAEFFCYARNISVIDNIFYHYVMKTSGIMSSGIHSANKIFNNKVISANQRLKLRKLYLEKHGIDIFPLYAGGLMMSVFELCVKFSKSNFRENKIKINQYLDREDVSSAFKSLQVKIPMKLRIPVYLVRHGFTNLIYTLFWLKNKMKFN